MGIGSQALANAPLTRPNSAALTLFGAQVSTMRKLAAIALLTTSLSACSLLPENSREPVRQTARPAAASAIAVSPEARTCLAQLGSSQANFTPIADKYFGAGCSNVNTVRLSSLRSDRAKLGVSNLGPVTCPLANTFAAWARFGVDRAARQILGSPLAKIETMGSYACRNVAGSSKRSAHASADAIDVSAFVLADGRRISLVDDWESGSRDERRFLRIVQDSACKRFGTVLGPEYNSAHRDHFHLERSGRGFCR